MIARKKSTRELVSGSGWDRFVSGVLVFSLVSFAVMGSLIGVGTVLFAFPALDLPARSDAVVVLGPPTVQRLVKAQEMVDDDLAETIVISVPADYAESSRHPRLQGLCAGDTDYDVVCLTPDPFTTQGEARLTQALMTENDWTSVIVVTSVTHVTRARLLFDRCFAGTGETTLFVSDERQYDPARWVSEYLYQTGAIVKALLHPSC